MTTRANTIAAAMWYQAIPADVTPVTVGGTDFTATVTGASVAVTTVGDVDVFWTQADDSITETVSDETVTHTYDNAGTYTIVLRANACSSFNIVASGLTTVGQWGNVATSYAGCLEGNTALTDVPATIAPGTDFTDLFKGCTLLNDSDIAGWDVDGISSMSGMFQGTAFDADISGWNAASCTDFSSMFQDNTDFNQDIGGWTINSAVVSAGMENMFNGATSFNQDLAHWRVDGVVSEPTGFSTGTTAWNSTLHPIWGHYPQLLMTETFTGADDDPVSASTWDTAGENSPTFTIQSNEAHIDPDWHAFMWLDTDPRDDFEATFTLEIPVGSGSGFQYHKFFFNSTMDAADGGTDTVDTGYVQEINPDGGTDGYITIIQKDNATNPWQDSDSTAAYDFATAGNRHHFRYRRIGTNLKVKVWEDGNPEPTTWNFADGSYSTYTSGQMGFGLSGTSGTDYLLVDDFEVWNLSDTYTWGAVGTGGTITTPGDGYVYHTFTSGGTFDPVVSKDVDYLIVGGGGGGGSNVGGGGGGGEVQSGSTTISSAVTITVGSGGAGGASGGGNHPGAQGGSSSISGVATAIGGGGGAGSISSPSDAGDGGSGGGGGIRSGNAGGSATGSGAGFDGGDGNTSSSQDAAGGGGGAGGAGGNASTSPILGGDGGPGIEWPSGSGDYYAGGGGGAELDNAGNGGGSGGIGGGGDGNGVSAGSGGYDGTANTGGGGGGGNGGGGVSSGGDGGSGIVIIRYAE